MKIYSLLFVFLAFGAQAQMERGTFESKPGKRIPNLIQEGESVTVLQEQSVQNEKFETRRLYGVNVGQAEFQYVNLRSNDTRVAYDTSKKADTFAINMGYLPIAWYGMWGAVGSVGYNYRENEAEVKTSLHTVIGDLLLTYRGEFSRRSWVKPQVGLGMGVMTVIQRGPDGYNTSEAEGVGVGSLGVNFNLTRLFKMDSPLDWELNAQYKQFFGPSEEDADWNGQMISAGIHLAL